MFEIISEVNLLCVLSNGYDLRNQKYLLTHVCLIADITRKKHLIFQNVTHNLNI